MYDIFVLYMYLYSITTLQGRGQKGDTDSKQIREQKVGLWSLIYTYVCRHRRDQLWTMAFIYPLQGKQ